jgi:hypothetical protein
MHSDKVIRICSEKMWQIGLDKGVFEKDPDGSVWIDLTDEGLDRKIVALRWYCGVYDAGYWNGHTT